MITDEGKAYHAGLWAEHVRGLSMRRRNLEDAIAELRGSLVLPAAPMGGRVASSPNPGKLSDGVMRLQALLAEYDAALDEWAGEVAAFERAACQLEPALCRVLTMRYVGLKPWREVAESVSYSRRHVFKLRDRALARLYDSMPVGWRGCPSPYRAPVPCKRTP